MNSFDDAVNRHRSEQRRANEVAEQQRAAQAAAQKNDAAVRAANELIGLLVQLAEYLSQRVRPTSVVLLEKVKGSWMMGTMGRAEFWSPDGFLLDHQTPSGRAHSAMLLMPEGCLWYWSGHDSRSGKYIDIHEQFKRPGPHLFIQEFDFSIDPAQTGLIAESRLSRGAKRCDPSDAMARIAARVLERSAG